MAIAARLKELLTANRIAHTVRTHQTAYTAQEIAAAQHVPGRQLAKCVLVKTDRGFALAVLPAVERIDWKKLKRVLKAKTLTLANEADITRAFPDVEVGAMAPFGNLYNIPTAVDQALAACTEIVCNAGSHTDTVTLRYQDFERLAQPAVGAFGQFISPPANAASRSGSTRSRGARSAARAPGRGRARAAKPTRKKKTAPPRRRAPRRSRPA